MSEEAPVDPGIDAQEALLRQIERAEERADLGLRGHARKLLKGLSHAFDANSEVGSIRRCLDLARHIDDHDLALHYALCLWSARPGDPVAHQAVSGAALFHPDRRVAGAGFRICHHRARSTDWRTIATADPYAPWPGITALCAGGAEGAPTIAELTRAGRIRSVGSYGTGAWVLGPARVTRTGKSIAIGLRDGASDGRPAYVPALSVWDPSAALSWALPPKSSYESLGLLATRFSYAGYWHWLIEGLLHAVRLDEAGLLERLDRLVICVGRKEPRFIPESLEAVGIPYTKVLTAETPFDCHANELVVPMRAPGFGGLIDETEPSDRREIIAVSARHRNDADIQAVRRRLGLGDGARCASRRLFVSRRDAAKRRVANEDRLLGALGGLGFEVIVPGSLTFAEQLAAFSSAEVVVGPHGAGLANTLFMPPGGAMVELHHVDFGRPYYRRLAEVVGLCYRDLACEPDPASPRDMVVAVDDATAVVRRLLGAKEARTAGRR